MDGRKTSLQGSMIFKKIEEFFSYYFMERDVEKTLSLLSEQIYSIGTGEGEVARGKQEFRTLLESEIATLQNPISFEIYDYAEKQRMENCWDCFFYMKIFVTTPDGIQVQYRMRNTVGLHWEAGRYWIDVLHASESSMHQEDGEFFPLKYVSNGVDAVNQKTKNDLLEIVRQVIPGGVVGGYAEEGYPLYAANEQYLKMAGYQTYHEFEQDIQGKIINSIHPDDREYVKRVLQHQFEYQDQYEVQYRLKKKDGTYLWVHDIGKKTVDNSGRNAIISVITDISEQILKRKRIEKEMSRDALTGLYNRKSGEERITKKLMEPCEYFFFMLDLDNFKKVNDIYGHAKGDEVLLRFAKLAEASFRSVDTVCRMGGDEFIIFVYGTSDMLAIRKKIKRVIEEYRDRMERNCPEAQSTVSVGGVFSNKPYSFAELYKKADEVLYEVKNEKKGEVKIRTI